MAKRTDRVAERPDPKLWGEDELMNLDEAARLHWPTGFITTRMLRRAVADGRLSISILSGRHLVTRRAIAALSTCERVRARVKNGDAEACGEGHGYLADLAAIDRMGRK
ncbi:hypothetical protein IVB33_08215 [Bradyrhizobium sp. 24]|uniref:hypothetical protein n=1 Tax=unclassified Bradyrhizobium TaxID=2631580 RepID=UPI001FFBCB23|nr:MULTISPECIES: hypothetical protein [unclassified Bradyrhizobium]MCK1298476.1 hypothetical protein [Bradyrhizobium sp. 37]MCK1378174.1 hypothetical protein [Bradyrhizobium sp. 24]MCK1769520.1 hypothetical protein [Bradyrhizobium sp. 134]